MLQVALLLEAFPVLCLALVQSLILVYPAAR